jgi:hypothetical protein
VSTRPQRIKGDFCEEKLAPKSAFDRGSFRWVNRGKTWLLIGCPKGHWHARGYKRVRGERHRGRCMVGTRAHVILHARQSRTRCSVGERRIDK